MLRLIVALTAVFACGGAAVAFTELRPGFPGADAVGAGGGAGAGA